jgi:hypothetical protein
VGQAAAASAKLQGGVAHRVLRTALLQLVPIGSGAVFSSVLGARRPNSCSQGRASRPLCGGYAKSPAPICLRSTAARHEAVGGRWQHVLTAHLLLLNVNVAPRRPTDSSRPAATAEPCRIQPAAASQRRTSARNMEPHSTAQHTRTRVFVFEVYVQLHRLDCS